MTAILGYARVSTIGQDLDAQLAALAAADTERVFTDKLSGSAKTARPGHCDRGKWPQRGGSRPGPIYLSIRMAAAMYAP